MPIYEYQCNCGLRFEKKVTAPKRQEPQKCVCGDTATWVMPKGVSISFKPKTEGMGPQNTGVSSWDHNADRVIGEDARKNWATAGERSKQKQDLLRSSPGKTGNDLARNLDGTYRIMGEKERQTSDAATSARQLHYDISRRIKDKTGVDI